MDIKRALLKKLKVLQEGKKIKDFDYLKPHEYEEKFGSKARAEKQDEIMKNECVDEKSRGNYLNQQEKHRYQDLSKKKTQLTGYFAKDVQNPEDKDDLKKSSQTSIKRSVSPIFKNGAPKNNFIKRQKLNH